QGLAGYGSVRQTTETTLGSLRLIGSAAYDARGDLGDGSRLRAQLYVMREEQRYRDPLGEISIKPEDTHDLTTTVGFNVHLSRPVVSWLRLAAVAEGRDQLLRPYDADDQPRQGDPATRVFGGTGVEADTLLRRIGLHVVPSLRVEVDRDVRSGRDSSTLQLANDAPAVVNVQPIARLAVTETLPGGFTVRANAGHYSRMPSLLELYGDSGFVEGNPKLGPETGWNADAGAEWRIARPLVEARCDLSSFASVVDGLIQFQQDAYGRAHAVNIGRARILGVESSVDVRVGRWARVIASFTYDDGRDVSDTSLGRHERQLPNRPRVHFYGRPEGRWPIRRDVTVGAYVDLDATDGNYLDPANLVELPARFLVGAGLFAEATRVHLVVIASAQNLGDARTFDYAGFPLPSRSFFVSARLSLPKENP
ncbi:MAG TPA: TonB-dependent receptor, partial [Polyangia bacterium]|nr:TonB-dependent receptor [Polyangia bacterium]